MHRSDHTEVQPLPEKEGASSCRDHKHTAESPCVLALLGGDARQLTVATILSEAGFEVRLWGFEEAEDGGITPESSHLIPKGVKLFHRADRVLEGCDAIILPYPATKDGKTVFCPLDTRQTVPLASIATYAKKHPEMMIFGGHLPKAWAEELRTCGSVVTEYEDNESFLIRNARLTAEGALMTAMNVTDTALLGSPVAVVGYGRIGGLLAHLLCAMGAEVTVFARRKESLAEAEAVGHHALETNMLHRLCEGYEVIFNTVPVPLISREILISLPCRTKIIELASAPGGLDPEGVAEATRRCGLQVIRAPALPGRYAPVDAGQAIAECILAMLEGVSI